MFSIRSWKGRAAAGALVGLLAVGCGGDTEEVTLEEGHCPTGEPNCSALVPEGLTFTMTHPSDLPDLDWAQLATGGEADVTFRTVGEYSLPDFRFEIPSNVTISDTRRTSDTGAALHLTATAAGTGAFRVLDSGGSGLLHQKVLRAAAVDHIEVHPAMRRVLIDAFLDPWSFAPDLESVTVLAALFDAEGGRLVDQNVSFSATDDPVGEGSWDQVTFSTPVPLEGELEPIEITVTATQGGTSGSTTITRALTIDDVVRATGHVEGVPTDELALECFVPTYEGRAVFGLTLDLVYGTGEEATLSFNRPCLDASELEEGTTLTVAVPYSSVRPEFVLTAGQFVRSE